MKHLALAALLLATPAAAATDFTKVMRCAEATQSVANLKEAAKKVEGTAFWIDGVKLKAFMAAANALPPPTDFKPDGVAGIAAKGTILFGLFDKKTGVLCGPIRVGKDISAPLLRILGIKEEAEEDKI